MVNDSNAFVSITIMKTILHNYCPNKFHYKKGKLNSKKNSTFHFLTIFFSLNSKYCTLLLLSYTTFCFRKPIWMSWLVSHTTQVPPPPPVLYFILLTITKYQEDIMIKTFTPSCCWWLEVHSNNHSSPHSRDVTRSVIFGSPFESISGRNLN